MCIFHHITFWWKEKAEDIGGIGHYGIENKNRRELHAVRDDDGAGKGNRTLLSSLGSLRSTDELYLRLPEHYTTAGEALQVENFVLFRQGRKEKLKFSKNFCREKRKGGFYCV